MYIIKPSWEILDGPTDLRLIEVAGRTCYKSDSELTPETTTRFVHGLIRSGHLSVLEHLSITVRYVCDRITSQSVERHRIAAYSQESTRYCNYSRSVKFTPSITMPWLMSRAGKKFTCGHWLSTLFNPRPTILEKLWLTGAIISERLYIMMLKFGATPEIARSVLLSTVKTEVVLTYNLREWRHFFNLRALGTTGKPHPEINFVACELLAEFARRWPAAFGDLAEKLESTGGIK